MSEMTVEKAVEVLNDVRHHEHSNWRITAGGRVVFCDDIIGQRHLSKFEAIATAEKHQREKHAELDRAIAVLNKHKHRGHKWSRQNSATGNDGASGITVYDDGLVTFTNPLTHFEVLAIADRYEKGSPK